MGSGRYLAEYLGSTPPPEFILAGAGGIVCVVDYEAGQLVAAGALMEGALAEAALLAGAGGLDCVESPALAVLAGAGGIVAIDAGSAGATRVEMADSDVEWIH